MGIARDIERERDRDGEEGRMKADTQRNTHTRTPLEMKNHPHQTLKDCQMVQL